VLKCSPALAVDHGVSFRSLHTAEFQRQSQVAAAAAAAVAGFSAFNLHSSSALHGGATDRRYVPHHEPSSKSTLYPSLSCYRITGDGIGQVGRVSTYSRLPPPPPPPGASYLHVAPPGNGKDETAIRRTYTQ